MGGLTLIIFGTLEGDICYSRCSLVQSRTMSVRSLKAILKPRMASFQEGQDDVTNYAKTTVTRPRNIKVTPMHEKLTVTVPKGKEAGILEAFSYIQIGSMILQISPPQDEVKPNFRTPPKKL